MRLFTRQASSYGGCASEEGEPDLQRRREEGSGQVQPRGAQQARGQDPLTAARHCSPQNFSAKVIMIFTVEK